MKKIILTLLCLFVILTLAACGNDTAETTDSSPETKTEKATESETEDPTETPTEAPTEESTEQPTESPTETPTESPSEESTEEPVVRPTDGPEIASPEYEKHRKTTYYPSVADLFTGLNNYDISDLGAIAKYESAYLFDTINKYHITDAEIKNGIFGNFRNRLLNENSIMLPYINGEFVSSNIKDNQAITPHSSGDYRTPTLIFQTDFSVAISTNYIDSDIVDEANRRGAAWTKSKLDPFGINIDNYREHFDRYFSQGYTFYKDAQAYEKTYTLGDRKANTFVLDYPISTTNNYVNVFLVYDDIFVCVFGKKAAVEKILPTLTFYECEFSTGKPLRDTPGRTAEYLAVK